MFSKYQLLFPHHDVVCGISDLVVFQQYLHDSPNLLHTCHCAHMRLQQKRTR